MKQKLWTTVEKHAEHMERRDFYLACVTLHYILVSEGVIRKAKHLHTRKLTSTQFAGDVSACAHFFLDLEELRKRNYLD